MQVLNTQKFDKNSGYNVSGKYTVINTASLLQGLEAAGYTVAKMSVARVNKAEKDGFQKHLFRLRPANTELVKGAFIPEVVIQNSYDGSSSFKVMLGMFRVVCANGLITGTAFESYRIRHVGDVMPQVLAASASVLKQVSTLQAQVELWQNITLTESQKYNFAVEASKLVLPVGALMPRIGDLLATHRQDDIASDLWTVYNRIQENVLHGGLRYTTSNLETGRIGHRTSRRIKAIDRNVALNRQLWDLASNFAA